MRARGLHIHQSRALLHPRMYVDAVCLWQAALFYVLKESFKIYQAISEGLINLADKFFDMDYFNAQRALEIYKESTQSAEHLQVTLLLLTAPQYLMKTLQMSGWLGQQWIYHSSSCSMRCKACV